MSNGEVSKLIKEFSETQSRIRGQPGEIARPGETK